MSNSFPFLGEEQRFQFPPVESASGLGIVAEGGNLSPGMLLSAYSQGIFPWYGEEEPILWWSPDPRFVLFPDNLHISRSTRRVIRKGIFTFSLDTHFPAVIRACGRAPRCGQSSTWITPEMIEAYIRLHRLGYAHSMEVWLPLELYWRRNREKRVPGAEIDPEWLQPAAVLTSGENKYALAGGIYGVALGRSFFGESMFSKSSDASKVGICLLAEALFRWGYHFLDSQVYTPHIERIGAREVSRRKYLLFLKKALRVPAMRGKWTGQAAFRGLPSLGRESFSVEDASTDKLP